MPQVNSKEVCDFLGHRETDTDFETLTKGVSNRSVGKWKQQLSEDQLAGIQKIAGPLLAELGYTDSADSKDLQLPKLRASGVGENCQRRKKFLNASLMLS